jgi:hypothetical protein
MIFSVWRSALSGGTHRYDHLRRTACTVCHLARQTGPRAADLFDIGRPTFGWVDLAKVWACPAAVPTRRMHS